MEFGDLKTGQIIRGPSGRRYQVLAVNRGNPRHIVCSSLDKLDEGTVLQTVFAEPILVEFTLINDVEIFQ